MLLAFALATVGRAAAEERYRPREPNYLWPTLEMATILGCGAGWYVLDRKTNQVDWDDPPLLARFDGDAWRLDTNRFGINFAGHPLTGALSYGIARGHDLSPGAAFAFSFGTSLAWELGVEFREKVSLNDVLVTAPAGVPIGELVYRTVVEAGAKLAPEDPLPEDARGRHVRGEVSLSVGRPFEAPERASDFARVDLAGALVWLPGYRGAGAFSRAFWGGEHLAYRTAVGASEAGGLFDGDATMLLAGYAAQGEPSGSDLRGTVAVGLPLGFRYRAASILGLRELVATTRFPGVGLEAHAERGAFAVDLAAEASFHLSGLSAPTARGWAPLGDGQVGKSIWRREGYFYGVGPALEARVRVAVGVLAVEGGMGVLGARSLDGLDRAQESLTVDEAIVVRRFEATGRVAVALPGDHGSVFAGAELVRWRSRVQSESDDLRALTATAGVAFAY